MNDFLARLAGRNLGHVPVLEPLALRFARGTLSLGPLHESRRALAEPPMRYRARGRAVFSLPRQDAEHHDAELGSAWPTSPGVDMIFHGGQNHGEAPSHELEVHAGVLPSVPAPATEPRVFRQLVASGAGTLAASAPTAPGTITDRSSESSNEWQALSGEPILTPTLRTDREHGAAMALPRPAVMDDASSRSLALEDDREAMLRRAL